jgi:hypothetical protein
MADIQLIKGAKNGNPSDSLPTMYDKVNKNTENINNQVVNHEGRLGSAEAAVSNHGSRISEAEAELITQDNRISNIIAHNGDGTKDTELIDARGGEAILSDRLDKTDEQLAEGASHLNSQWINVLYPPPPFNAAHGNGTNPDTSIIQSMMDTGRKLYWPTPSVEYLIDDTLYPKLNSFNWEGEFWLDTKIKFTGVNKEFLYGVSPTPVGGVTYSPNYGTIRNMAIEGLGTASLQTAFNIVGYMTTIDKLMISGFNQIGVTAGVYVDISNCYFRNNNNGFILGPNTSPGADNISTMIRFKSNRFIQNTGTAITNKNGSTYYTVISLCIQDCGFELGGKPLDLRNHQYVSITDSWFEGNASSSSIQKSGLFTNNNKFNSPDQNFSYPSIASGAYAYGTGGSVDIISGLVSLKEVAFQFYNNDHVQDNGSLKLRETDKNGKRIIDIVSPTANVTPIVVNDTQTSALFNGEYHLYIKADGTTTHDFASDVTITVTRTAAGTYQISFGSKQIPQAIVNVGVLNANTFNMTQQLWHHLEATNTVDPDNFNTYNSFTRLTVYVRDRNAADALTDARVLVTIKPNMWNW